MKVALTELPQPQSLPDDGPAVPRPVAAELLAALRGGDAEARRGLAGGEALLVVTGQQPCFPLPLGLTLQKAATAVALARRLADRLSRPVLPLFWSGADDSDFEEARAQLLARPGRPPLRVALPAALERRGAFVGGLAIGAAWRDYAELAPEAAGWAPRPGEDLGTQQARLLAELFAPWGLLVLDARESALRRAGRGLFLTYAERRQDFAAAIDTEGDRLAAGLGRRPLRAGLGERALFFLRGDRRNLPHGEVYADQLDKRLKARAEDLSPNAALRPLLQDAVFPVAAAVLGPGEWDYHLQLRPGYETLGQAFPPAWPRLRAAWAGDEAVGLDDAGRASSPLARSGHPLASPRRLVQLAAEHLEDWERGRLAQRTLPTEERKRA